MAKNSSLIKISGTLGDLTFYRMDGKDIVRRKTSLNKKRVKSDPAFKNSRKSSAVFGAASSLAKETYWALPKEKRKHGLIGKLTGVANTLLHAGKDEVEVREALRVL